MAIFEENKEQSLKSILGPSPFDWQKPEESIWGESRPTLEITSLSPEQQSLYDRLTAQDKTPGEKGTWEAFKAAALPEVYGKEYAGAIPQERLEEKSLPEETLGGIAYGALSFRKLPYQVAKIIGGDVLGSETVKKAVTPLIENIEALQQTPGIAPSKKAESKIDLTGGEKPVGEQITETITNPHFWAANLPPALWSLGEYFIYGGGAAALARKALGLEKALATAATPAAAAKIASKIDKMSKITGYGTGMAMEAAAAEEELRRWEKENPGKQISWGQRVLIELGTGVVAGSLEAMSFERIFRGKQGMTLVRKVLDSIATEGTTEGAQEIIANAFKKYGYEPRQDLLEGVVESILVGAAIGGLAGAGEHARKSIPQVRERVKNIIEGYKQERAEAAAAPTQETLPSPSIRFPIYRTGPTIQAGMAQPILPPEERVIQKTGKQELLPGFEYTVIIQPEERSAPLEPGPPGTPTLYGPAGELARFPEYVAARWRVLADYEEALSKPAHQRTAEEKWLVDTVQRRGIEAALPVEFRTPGLGGPGVSTVLGPWGGPASAGPPSAGPILDAQGKPIDLATPPPSPPELVGPSGRPIVKQPLPPAFGGPRPEPIATTGDETTEAATVGKEPVPARPAAMAQADLLDKVQRLARRVDQYGDPRDTKELSDLLAANRETLRDLFTVPPEDRSGLRPIAERLYNLMREVEETGDPGAARELHDLIAGNREILQGVRRWEIANEAGKFPEPMETQGAVFETGPVTDTETGLDIERIRDAITKAFQDTGYDIDIMHPRLAAELADIISKAGDWLNNEEAGTKLAGNLQNALRRAGLNTIEVLHYSKAIIKNLREGAKRAAPTQEFINEELTNEVINGIEPHQYDSAKSRAWTFNFSADPEYYTDGTMIIPAKAIVASPSLVNRVRLNRKHPTQHIAGEAIKNMWNSAVGEAVYKIEIVGQWGEGVKAKVLVSADDDSRYVVLDKDRMDLLHHLVKFDEVRMADSLRKPVVLYRQGTPVAVLAGMNHPGIDVAAVRQALAEKQAAPPPPPFPDLEERKRRFIEGASNPDTARSLLDQDIAQVTKDIREGRITADEVLALLDAANTAGFLSETAYDHMRDRIEAVVAQDQAGGKETEETITPRPLKEFNTLDLADLFQNLLLARARIRNQAITAKEVAALAQKAFTIPQDRLAEYRKQIEEAFELALVREAQGIVKEGQGRGAEPYEIFQELQRLYNLQPALTSRTSESIRNQAYSTPVPLAYLMSRAVRLTQEDYVYEPTAGNGMLLIEANPEITLANELDPLRAEHLKRQGFNTTTENAIGQVGKPGVYPKSFDVVLMNPPFGTLDEKTDFDGYKIRKLEHLIALHALKAMDDNGRAAIIIGGHSFATNLGKPTTELTGTDRIFFNYLYSHYNVTHHINIDGSVYRRMGTSFPIRLLIIEGRKAVPDQTAAPYRPDQIEWAQTFEDVYKLLKSEIEEGKPSEKKVPPYEMTIEEIFKDVSRESLDHWAGLKKRLDDYIKRQGKYDSTDENVMELESLIQEAEEAMLPIIDELHAYNIYRRADIDKLSPEERREAERLHELAMAKLNEINQYLHDYYERYLSEFPSGGKEKKSPPPKQPPKREPKPPESPKPPKGPTAPEGGAPTIIKGQLADGTVVDVPVPPGVQPPGKGAILKLPDGTTITIMERQAPFMVKEEEGGWRPQLTGPENLKDWLLNQGHAAGTRAFGTLRKYKALDAPAMVKASVLMIAGDPNFRRSIHDWVFKETIGEKGGAYRRILKGLIDYGLPYDQSARMLAVMQAYALVHGRMDLSLKSLSQELGLSYALSEPLLRGMSRNGLLDVEFVKDLDNVYIHRDPADPTKPDYSVWQKLFPRSWVVRETPTINWGDINWQDIQVIEPGRWVETADGKVGRITKVRGAHDWAKVTLETEAGPITVGVKEIVRNVSEPIKKEKPPEKPAGEKPPEKSALQSLEEEEAESGAHQVIYKPVSKGPSLNAMAPKFMADALHNYITELEARVGKIDQYVAEKLHYASTEELYKVLGAEQIETVALAINAIENGPGGFIMGHQTGVGKGRVVAAMMRYARSQGLTPIFFTAHDKLFSDIYRDIEDITEDNPPAFWAEYKPLIIASSAAGARVYRSDGTVLKELDKAAIEDAEKNLRLTQGHNGILTTYYQIQRDWDKKHDLINALSGNALIILDESHKASGEGQSKRKGRAPAGSKRRQFITEILQHAKGVVYSSATYAKRPDNLPLYFKTDIGTAVNVNQLVRVMQQGGVPLQEWVANQLAINGQMSRLELSFAGVSLEPKVDSSQEDYEREQSDKVTMVARKLVRFSKALQQWIETELYDTLVKKGEKIRPGDITNVEYTHFGSLMHNMVSQLLFSLRVGLIINEAITQAKDNKKVVIGCYNTMDAFINDGIENGYLKEGAPLNLTFSEVLKRAVDKSLYYRVTIHKGGTERRRVLISMLPYDLQQAYYELRHLANSTTSELIATPIDVIGRALTKAGLKVGEITGRKWAADWSSDDLILRKRDENERRDKNTPVNRFNSGELDVLIVNSAAAEGLSLHASERFKDQRQRVMILGQLALDISDVIQLLGRVHRTGQLHLPIYKIALSSLPTEVRPLIVLTKKLISLAANVTAKGETAYTLSNIKDSMNQYGDRVLAEMFAEDPEAMLAITGDSVSEFITKEYMAADFDKRVQLLQAHFPDAGGLVKRVTGYVAIESVENQKKFYQAFDARYDDYVESLKQAGEYTLGSEVMDLQAETVARLPMVDGDPRAASGLLQPTYMETVRAKLQYQPFTAKEVQGLIDKTLKGRTAEQFRDDLLAQVEQDFQAWAKGLEETIEDPVRRRQVLELAERELAAVKEALGVFLIGGRWDIQLSSGTSWSRVLTSIVYRPGVGNPAKLSHFKLVMVENTAQRRRTGTMRQFMRERIWSKPREFGPGDNWNESIFFSEDDLKGILDEYAQATNLRTEILRNEEHEIESVRVERPTSDEHKEAYDLLRSRFRELNWTSEDDKYGWLRLKKPKRFYIGGYETRYIVTGNLLAEIKKGQYVYFTRADGRIEFGKLMPRNYDPADDKDLQYVTLTVAQTEDWLRRSQNQYIVNYTHDLMISVDPLEDDAYLIHVPLAKARGGKFYLDQDLLNLVGTFRGISTRTMEAKFPESRLREVLELLRDKFGVTFSLARREYEKFFGRGGQYARVLEEGEPLYKKVTIGGVGQRLVPNPKVADKLRKEEEAFAYGAEWQSRAVVREGVKRATEVSQKIEALRTGTVPDRLSAKSYKARVALEYGERKYVNITGYKLTQGQEAKELAELMAVFRTPRQENFHAVYTDKDGVILAHTAVTSGALNYVAFTGKMVYDFVRRAERLGAAKVHFIHNHPSGNPAMSREDIVVAQMWKNGVANLPGLGDKMGEFVVIDGTTFSYYDWQTDTAVQAHYNARSFARFLTKKEKLTSPVDVASLGSSLNLGSEEIAVAYLNSQNEINVCEIHHASLLDGTPEKVAAKLKARAKAFDSVKVVIITPSFVLTSNLTSGDVKLGDWLLDIVTLSGLTASTQAPHIFEKPSGSRADRPAMRLFETQAEYDAATPQEVVDRYRDTYIALPDKKGIVQKLKDGIASLPEVLEDLYSSVVDRWGAWEKLALRTGTKLAEKGLVIPAGENIVNCLSFMRGIEGRVRQGIVGDHVYLDPMEFDPQTLQMVFSGEAPEIAGDSLVRRLEPLKEIAKQRGAPLAEVTSDLFHVLMPAQRDLELAGEYGNRLPGKIKGVHPEDSKAVITALKAKYGEDGFAKLDEVADSVREWADTMILQPLLRVGMLSQELYEDIKAKNQFYVPFKRLLEGLDDYIAANAGGAGVKGKVIQRIKGSEKQVLDPLEMLIEMAYKANFAYARNRVYRGLYILAKYADMEEIKEVPAKFVPVPITLKQEIDSVLRPQLESLARALGFDVKMLLSAGKNRLGYFQGWIKKQIVNGQEVDDGGEIVVRFATTEKTLSHEIGHGLDQRYKLQNLLIDQGTPEMKRELRRIADQRCGPGAPASYRKYVRKREEQVAEFVNRFITERDVCRRTAPQATAKFEEFLRSKPELRPLLEFAPTARPNLRDFYTKLWVRSPFPPEPGTLPYYRQGVLRWLKVPPDIYNAAVNMMPSELGVLMKIAKFPADLLRAGAVLNPEFISRNPVRDIIQAWLFSSFGFNPLLWFRDAFQLLKKDPAAKELQRQWEAGGGPLATLAQSFTDPERITAEQIADPSKFRYFPHPLQALRHLSAFLENLTRFSIYKQAREKGLTHAEAIHESRRTTLDFSRVGGHPAVRYLGMLIPFFNASIQGMDKLVSELKGPNRKKVWFRLSILATVSILLYLLASRDKRYKELEPWERNYFWHIPLGPDQPILRIPKPFEAGIMFGSVPVAMLEWALGRSEGKGVKQALEAAWQAAMPEIVPTLARPIIEFQANYDFFRGRAIEDEALKKLPVQLRAKPWTTEAAKAWGKHFGEATGISPVMMEHFIRSLGGGFGANYLLPGVDVILRKAGVLQDMPRPAQDAIERVWGVRAFFSKPPTGYRARSVNDFFEKYQNVVQAEAAWKMLLKTGKLEEANKYLRSHPEIMFARVARKAISQMGDLKGQRDTIYNDTKLTAEQKRAKLDKIDAQLLAIAQKANIFMDSKVADKVGIIPKMPIGQQKKDIDQYSNMLLSPANRAFKKLALQWPALAQMDEDKRRNRIIHAIRTENALVQAEVERKAQAKMIQASRHPSIWDRATKEENERAQEEYGTFIKIPTPWKTGFRLKREVGS